MEQKLEIPQTHAEQRGMLSNPDPEVCGSVLCLSLEFNPGNRTVSLLSSYSIKEWVTCNLPLGEGHKLY